MLTCTYISESYQPSPPVGTLVDCQFGTTKPDPFPIDSRKSYKFVRHVAAATSNVYFAKPGIITRSKKIENWLATGSVPGDTSVHDEEGEGERSDGLLADGAPDAGKELAGSVAGSGSFEYLFETETDASEVALKINLEYQEVSVETNVYNTL